MMILYLKMFNYALSVPLNKQAGEYYVFHPAKNKVIETGAHQKKQVSNQQSMDKCVEWDGYSLLCI